MGAASEFSVTGGKQRANRAARGSARLPSEQMPGKSKPGPKLGQNFLVDVEAVERIVGGLGDLSGRTVVEIGPGRGALTENVEILSALQGRTRLLALTNWPGETFELIRSQFGFLSWFDGIVVSGREGIAKPDPEIFELLTDRFRLEPAATLFIDDSPRHIAAAQRMGYQVHHFQSSSLLRERLAQSGLID